MASGTAKLHQLEWPLLAAVITVILAAAFAVPASAARRHPVRLHFYMHDIAGETAVQVVKGTGPLHPSMPPGGRHLGDTTVMDDLLTEGPGVDSKAVGRAQGSYVLAGLVDPVVVVTATVKFTDGPYNGSTIVIAGPDDVLAEVRELAVVGGTGQLRRASGHVLWRTAEVLSKVHYVLELDVYASVPAASARAANVTPHADINNRQAAIELSPNLLSKGNHPRSSNGHHLHCPSPRRRSSHPRGGGAGLGRWAPCAAAVVHARHHRRAGADGRAGGERHRAAAPGHAAGQPLRRHHGGGRPPHGRPRRGLLQGRRPRAGLLHAGVPARPRAGGLHHRRAHRRALQGEHPRHLRPRRHLRGGEGAGGGRRDGQAPASHRARAVDDGEAGVAGAHGAGAGRVRVGARAVCSGSSLVVTAAWHKRRHG